MNFLLLQNNLKESISSTDELSFYRKRTQIIKELEQSIRRARNPHRKQALRECLEMCKRETPHSVCWQDRVEEAKLTAHLDDWADL